MEYQGSHVRDFLETNGHVVLQRVDNNCKLRSFTQEDIHNITGGYCTVLGEGGFSKVCKGKLSDQLPVAVKRYKNEIKKEEFAKEVIVHSQINHKNVVRLLGVCTEENALMIVMEYMCNGNLYNILHCCNASGPAPFPLDKRLDIAIESAEVLSCMHSMYSPVLHGDIKPANILLDENYLPKLSDFGISRLLSTDENQHTNTIIGSTGYLDPLYINSGKLTPKSDVYSFGVVLLEMITRRKVVDGNTILTQCFTEFLRKGKKVRQLFDEEIVKEKRNIKLIDGIAKLASECLKMEHTIRPEMVEVADRFRMIRKSFQQRKGGISTVSNSGHIRKGKAENMLLPAPVKPTGTTTPTVLPAIPLDELKEITNNFSNDAQIGEGLYARVFSGVLRDGQKSALKKFKFHVQIHFKVPAVSRFKHENVVQLLGYCIDGNDRVLAYEYASGGSLHDILHGKENVRRTQRGPVLSWTQRVKIALSAAEGLEFLHREIGDHQTNVKSSNILFFGNSIAKIGDFGVSIQALDFWDDILDRCDYPTISGYDAPEYAITREASTKSDVYSFGVVLLELITGRKAVDHHTLPRGQQNLVGWVCKQVFTDVLSIPRLGDDKVKQCVKECVDPRLLGDYPFKGVAEMTAIAGLCVQHEAGKRPDMSVVVKALRQLLLHRQ